MAYIVAIGIAFFCSYVAFKLKSSRGIRYLGIALIFMGIWILSYVLSLASTDFGFKIIMLCSEFGGLIASVFFWYIFVIHYTQYNHLLKKWVLVALAFIPVVTFIEILTIPYHNFFYEDVKMELTGGLWVLSKTYGPGFYVWVGYGYFLLVSSFFIVFFKMISLPRKYRRQILPLAVAVAISIVPNVLYIIGFNPIHPLDISSLSFVFVGSIMLYSVFRQNFLDIVPVAYSSVVEKSKIGILILDNQNRMLDINFAAKKIFEADSMNLIGRSIEEIWPEYKSFMPDVDDDTDHEREVSFGSKIYEIKISPLYEKNDDIAGRTVVLWDVSQLKEALNELDAYAHTVAHDLKSPIGNMMGWAELLKNTISEKEPREMADQIISNGLKINSIINEILKLAKIRELDVSQMSPVDLAAVVEQAISRSIDDSERANVQLKVQETWPELNGNPIWIEEIWANLISNAYKYGGDPPFIQIGCDRSDQFIRFWVRDNGDGISAEDQEKLFLKFSELHADQGKAGGHGLGLSIVHRIVEKLGGQVWVESESNSGSTFYFTLPVNVSTL